MFWYLWTYIMGAGVAITQELNSKDKKQREQGPPKTDRYNQKSARIVWSILCFHIPAAECTMRLSARWQLACCSTVLTIRGHAMPSRSKKMAPQFNLLTRRLKHSHAGLSTRVLGFHVVVNGVVLALVIKSREAAQVRSTSQGRIR